MSQTPTTVAQIALLIMFVLPGVTFQLVRERFRGPISGHRDLGERVLRAVAATVTLDAVYLIIAGPSLVRLVYAKGSWFGGVAESPRIAAVVALMLFVAIPASAAWTVSWRERRRSASAYRPVPTSWDFAVQRKPCFVRVRTTGGDWVGGWYGTRSHASSHPNATDLYLESSWRMSAAGEFLERVEHTAGLYLHADEIRVLEFIEAPVTLEEATP